MLKAFMEWQECFPLPSLPLLSILRAVLYAVESLASPMLGRIEVVAMIL